MRLDDRFGVFPNRAGSENLWRLVAQEDTDGDQKITVHDRTTPFVIHDQNGAAARTLTNFYQMSVLLQELKRADDQHTKETLWTICNSTNPPWTARTGSSKIIFGTR